LRETGLVAYVRHPLLDSWVLEEVFRLRVYEPPAEALELLAELGRPPRVLDLGGNVGFFGLYVHGRLPGCTIVSFEPDPANAALLSRARQANGLEGAWRLVEACAASDDGTVQFVSSGPHSRVAVDDDRAAESRRERTLELFPFLEGSPLLEGTRVEVAKEDVFPFLADADLVKIDIEGGEWELLSDPRFEALGAAAIVLEYHPAFGPPDAHARVREALERAGYAVEVVNEGADASFVWAWRRDGKGL
jgi:FkbM family methyltransferase